LFAALALLGRVVVYPMMIAKLDGFWRKPKAEIYITRERERNRNIYYTNTATESARQRVCIKRYIEKDKCVITTCIILKT
jgi:hypothetical protein